LARVINLVFAVGSLRWLAKSFGTSLSQATVKTHLRIAVAVENLIDSFLATAYIQIP
jgi:hypothetical protein